MTCRQVRSTLLQFRNQLRRVSLRCRNEVMMTSRLVNLDIPVRVTNLMMILESLENCGTFGKCARDMVAECQRCSAIVCRVMGFPPLQSYENCLAITSIPSNCLCGFGAESQLTISN